MFNEILFVSIYFVCKATYNSKFSNVTEKYRLMIKYWDPQNFTKCIYLTELMAKTVDILLAGWTIARVNSAISFFLDLISVSKEVFAGSLYKPILSLLFV